MKSKETPSVRVLAVGESETRAYIDAVYRHPEFKRFAGSVEFEIIDHDFSFDPVPKPFPVRKRSSRKSTRRT